MLYNGTQRSKQKNFSCTLNSVQIKTNIKANSLRKIKKRRKAFTETNMKNKNLSKVKGPLKSVNIKMLEAISTAFMIFVFTVQKKTKQMIKTNLY